MSKELLPGITLSLAKTVKPEDTAAFYGSGLHNVFSTPAMIALMEGTSMKSVEPFLDEGEGTVGTGVNIKHLKATPVGREVTCTSTLIKVEDRRLTFTVEAFDSEGKIGEGTHERFIIDNDRFIKKNNSSCQ